LATTPNIWEEKIVPIPGDISLPKLGISEEDEALLAENVSIVFHMAASVQFTEPLRDSITYNVISVQQVVQLCRKMTNLECLIHVSTAYANCQLKTMDEKVYPSKIHYKEILNILNWFTDDMLELITPSLLDGRPNTYTYSKSLGEQVIAEEAKDLPTAIVRPSIIAASSLEPLPGWIDVFHGPGGLFVACGKGLLRVLRADIYGKADLIPLDYVVNMLITAGWSTALSKSEETPVYHINTGTQNPIIWLDLYPIVIKAYHDNPFDWIFRRPHIYLCQPPSFWPIWQFFLHYIPAYIFDFVYAMMRKKTGMVRIYTKLEKAIQQLDYFTQNSWEVSHMPITCHHAVFHQWSNDNTIRLLSIMSNEDRQTFNFDVNCINWTSYVERFCMGTKKYLLKDDPRNLQKARQQITRLRNIRYAFNFVLFLLATRLVYIRSQLAREIWSSVLGMCLQFIQKLRFTNSF
jgi:fatty acyl-CoA reductase